jgi:hypothetical protein
MNFDIKLISHKYVFSWPLFRLCYLNVIYDRSDAGIHRVREQIKGSKG